ncbi:phosphatidic acid phosphatase type 2/haloperoxidase [Rhizoctonia solani]|nr:phosphatidic acid phosphatase type 2/haloperoxidase [Rhizoctonia solani]
MFTIRRALRTLPIPKFNPRPLRDGYRRQPKSFSSYLPDWLLTAALGLLIVILNHVDGFRREFDLTDPSISHKYKPDELVPGYALQLISFVAPLLIMWSINLAMVRSWWDAHSAALGISLGLAITSVTTHLVKVTVGRPRPDLLHRCQPVSGAINHQPNEFFGLATWTVCTQTDKIIMRDGWRSFWSGHASGSFAGLSFLSYYMAGKLHMFDEQGYTAKVWVALAPFLIAILVAISRTVDNRHHWQDVAVGAIIGINLGYFAYRQYYPSLADKLSHEAYKARLSPFERDMPREEPQREGSRDEESAPLIENCSDRGMGSPHPNGQ